jgi:protein phosphatase 1L
MLYVVEDIGGRPYQEDRHSVKLKLYQDYDYVAIFDGHGGHQVSDFLKFHLKDFVLKHLQMKKHPKQALMDAFEDANDSMPIEMSFLTGSATLVILKRNSELWVANAGDSRAIMVSHRVTSLSSDHKPHRKDEFERITQLGGTVTFHPNDVPRVQGNLALSRSLGDKYLYPFVASTPEVKHFNLTKDCKYIVLATDGLWDVVSNVEVKNMVEEEIRKERRSIKHLAHDIIHHLLAKARERHSQDNTTIIFWML